MWIKSNKHEVMIETTGAMIDARHRLIRVISGSNSFLVYTGDYSEEVFAAICDAIAAGERVIDVDSIGDMAREKVAADAQEFLNYASGGEEE